MYNICTYIHTYILPSKCVLLNIFFYGEMNFYISQTMELLRISEVVFEGKKFKTHWFQPFLVTGTPYISTS